jgi:superfamily II DNA or RNA helicase
VATGIGIAAGNGAEYQTPERVLCNLDGYQCGLVRGRHHARHLCTGGSAGGLLWAGYMGTGGMVTDYEAFIKRKQRRVEAYGFDIGTDKLNPNLFDWQKRAVQWAIKRGRAALFEECGLGKTLQQLEWARLVHQHCGLPVVVHCPVGVRSQTKREAEKFGIDSPVTVADSQDEVINGINLINYEKLHKFDPATFCGVVLDESSILKGMNSVTRKLLKESYGQTRFRLACTATPAPNDHMELGNHAEFLGICEPVDMLNRYFVHDSGDTSKWRLRGHAERDFWSWVSQWAVCISKPSDIGGEDAGYALPQMIIERHHVTPEIDNAPSGMLFNTAGISATTMHEEKRLTNEARCKRAAELAKATSGPVLIWCDTNYEADELRKHLPDAVEVRGDDKDKEGKLLGFADGQFRVLISKPSIAGFGMNYQHCDTQIFAGLSYSFEAYYQAVRRSWRFGQKKPVKIHIVIADSDSAIESAVARKESDHAVMQSGMAQAMSRSNGIEWNGDMLKQRYRPSVSIQVPSFIEGAVACK